MIALLAFLIPFAAVALLGWAIERRQPRRWEDVT